MRRSPLKPISKKRGVLLRKRTKMLARVFGETPNCVRCGGKAEDAHEVLSRAQGGSIVDEANVLPLCRQDHQWVTEHPKLAAAEGLLVSRKWSAK